MQQRSRTATSLPELPQSRRQAGPRASEYGGYTYDPRLEQQAFPEQQARQKQRRPTSQPVLRSQPTAETADALRNLLDQHLETVTAQEEAEKFIQAEREQEQAAEDEALDPQTAELFEMLQAAEQRATYAEQQAAYAGQQAAQVAQQLAVQTANAPLQAALAHDDVSVQSRGSSLVALGGWFVALLAVALGAGTYFTSYRPLVKQLEAQAKLTELQAHRSSETEAELRRSFDRERETLNEQLAVARAAAAVAANAATADASAAAPRDLAADGGDRAATAKTAKAEARAAKHEAWLAKKAERAAKREARAAKHKSHASAPKDSDDSEKKAAAEPKHKAKPAASDSDDDTGSNDPSKASEFVTQYCSAQ